MQSRRGARNPFLRPRPRDTQTLHCNKLSLLQNCFASPHAKIANGSENGVDPSPPFLVVAVGPVPLFSRNLGQMRRHKLLPSLPPPPAAH